MSTYLSTLNKCELSDLLYKINTLPFTFRERLNISPEVCFGSEIETNSVDVIDMFRKIRKFNLDEKINKTKYMYMISDDITVDAEVITPVMNDTKEHWDYFYKLFVLLNESGATIGDNTSNHVHVGTHLIRSTKDLSTLLKILVVFEPILYKFGYGYSDIPRSYIKASIDQYNYASISCPSRFSKFIDYLDKSKLVSKQKFKTFISKELALKNFVNFEEFMYRDINKKDNQPNDSDQIEIRCFNGTLDPVIAQNNICIIASIIDAIYSGRIDLDYINNEYNRYKLQNYNFDSYCSLLNVSECYHYNKILNSFNNVNVTKALKFADMIFTSDREKLYFLKQYLKLFELDEKYICELEKKL